MLFPKSLLWANSLIFSGFGLGYIIAPNVFASFVDMRFTEPNALIDARSIYGGLLIGVGVWYGYCALCKSHLFYGLLSAAYAASGILLGRLVGLFISGSPNGITLFYLVAETVVAASLIIAIWRMPPDARPSFFNLAKM